ncbi:MAG: zinc-ribbon domain-containing protein [Planctomycetota bacterium]|jgi:predicted Zn finger-like uncharacterized protein
MKTQCPHCESKFNAADEHEGKTVKCSKCGEAFKIVSIAAAEEPSYPGTPADGKKGLGLAAPLLGVFVAVGMTIVGMVIDEPFSYSGLIDIGVGGFIGGLILAGLDRLISGSWRKEGKVKDRELLTVVCGMVLGLSVIALLRWEEAQDEWFVVWFGANTAIKIVILIVLLSVNIPIYILVARRVSASFRKILAGGLGPAARWYVLIHTLAFAGICLAQYMLIKMIFLN